MSLNRFPIVAVAGLLCAAMPSAHAETAKAPQSPQTPRLGKTAKDGTLSERLGKSNGVIKPPGNSVGPVIRPDHTGSTPVIRPSELPRNSNPPVKSR